MSLRIEDLCRHFRVFSVHHFLQLSASPSKSITLTFPLRMAPNSVRSVAVFNTNDDLVKATAGASTLADLISTVPQTWRPAIAQSLTSAYRTSSKLCTVQNTIAQYERHDAERSFPPSIVNSARDPKIQFSKEFLGTEGGRLTKSTISATLLDVRKTLLQSALTLKKEELAALQKLVAFDEKSWRKTLMEVAERVSATYNATIVPKNDGTYDWKGAPVHSVAELGTLWAHGSAIHYRACALARSLADRSLVEKTRTLSLKKETDVDMKDADTELTTREVVRDELSGKLAAIERSLAELKSTSTGKRQGAHLTIPRPRKKARIKAQGWQGQRQDRLEPSPSRRRDQKEGPAEEEGQEMSVNAFLSQCSKEFRSWLPETYPTVYGSLSSQCRLKIAAALSKTWELDTVRTASPGVFQRPGISLPEDIEYALACNHKFILPQAPSLDDIEGAKDRLCRTVRNRWLFRDKASSNFIPKFHIPNPRWTPPRASRAIEQGLDAAMEVIDDQCRRALTSIAVKPATQPYSSWMKVRDYLESNKLLAKLTDKNLGLAVFPVGWYDTEVLAMLSDEGVYLRVSTVPTSTLVKTLMELIPKWRLPQVMRKYLYSKIKLVLPEFHAIPKVHKTPWTLRPIVPSHSWVTTSASEVLDHLLQPLLEKLPWVIDSSKAVIQQLEKVQVTSMSPVWIMTGDVTSFYTNIPPQECAKVIAGAWDLYCHSSSISSSAILSMVRFVMDNNFFAYQGQTFRQIKGLAMGTSCAPVLANIYAAYFERKARIVHQEGVLLYVRYIDDILCLFQGTKKAAARFAEVFRLGHLEVRWSVSSLRNEFLDIELIRGNQQLGLRVCETRLFRKELNKHLYIPWSSAHPLHVKKGFVKAELTRLAIISSKNEFFAEARKEFYGNLRRRGYPPQALNLWFQQVQYDSRPTLLLPKIRKESAPLMLSGHYNPVWEYVDVKEVLASARRFWAREELPESLKESLIRSLGRTTSLFDLLSTWNKTILLSSSEEGPEFS